MESQLLSSIVLAYGFMIGMLIRAFREDWEKNKDIYKKRFKERKQW